MSLRSLAELVGEILSNVCDGQSMLAAQLSNKKFRMLVNKFCFTKVKEVTVTVGVPPSDLVHSENPTDLVEIRSGKVKFSIFLDVLLTAKFDGVREALFDQMEMLVRKAKRVWKWRLNFPDMAFKHERFGHATTAQERAMRNQCLGRLNQILSVYKITRLDICSKRQHGGPGDLHTPALFVRLIEGCGNLEDLSFGVLDSGFGRDDTLGTITTNRLIAAISNIETLKLLNLYAFESQQLEHLLRCDWTSRKIFITFHGGNNRTFVPVNCDLLLRFTHALKHNSQ
jgi:hypothetical protein